MLSSSSGTLVIKSATKENSGDYVCRAQTGDFYVESQKIKVIVYGEWIEVLMHANLDALRRYF